MTPLIKIIPVGTKSERLKEIRDFEYEKGGSVVVYTTKRTFVSHIKNDADFDSCENEVEVDGIYYLIAKRFLFGAEVILSDGVLVLV